MSTRLRLLPIAEAQDDLSNAIQEAIMESRGRSEEIRDLLFYMDKGCNTILHWLEEIEAILQREDEV